MNVLCRLGIHSYVQDPRTSELPDSPQNRVCRRCGKHFGFSLGLSRWWGGMNGITAGELRAALEGVPDDVEVEVGSNSLFGWAGAESAYLTTKNAIGMDDPQAVPVFRIAGGAHGGGGLPPGMGSGLG
jgi:hypothetical protein